MDLQLDIFGDAEAPGSQTALAEQVVAATATVVIAGHLQRILARSSDRVAWLRARSQGVTATDAAGLSTTASIMRVAREKTGLRGFTGNAFTEHGREREPHIARWVHDHFSLVPSDALFHAVPDRRHLATPDCISDDGTVLAEIKTTSRPFDRIPKHYLRQIWWQQYVLGAERTLFVWEQHDDFVPVGPPRHQWVERDEDEIAALVDRADRLLELLGR
ncbi:YqaJ viral recombinase family protein [Agrococcus carbonis]|uniref:YqaJ-like recombinase domain-containing protein n=1 Tax=Agrococcus carbonis TaxID=684552 RepID=A0A1H1MK08_9MICO|nr:YqaJ viral recombinase family protein [Agrococcus carbonis]SDR86950.1 YqaJ-like recombinase domain-containing protein [Agrococcus carbonis]